MIFRMNGSRSGRFRRMVAPGRTDFRTGFFERRTFPQDDFPDRTVPDRISRRRNLLRTGDCGCSMRRDVLPGCGAVSRPAYCALFCSYGKEETGFCFRGVLRDRPADGGAETRFSGLLCRGCGAGFRGGVARRGVARLDARQHRRGICCRPAAAADARVALGAVSRTDMAARAERLLRADRRPDGRDLRRGRRTVPALGIPARFDGPDLPCRSEGGHGERRFLARACGRRFWPPPMPR